MMSCHSPDPPSHCFSSSPALKLYQAFIFSVPVFFTFILLFLFYVFCLRRRASWPSIRMRASNLASREHSTPSEIGIKKELREMLPVVVFKESFYIRETECSVCLGDYQADERLQRMPQCGHTFHVDCIDHWLATNSTCPLCRVSLLPATKTAPRTGNHEVHESHEDRTSGLFLESLRVNHENGEQERERNYDLENSTGDLPRELEDMRHDEGGSVVIDVQVHQIAEENLRL